MEIIKHGNGAKRSPRTFICKECGCTFVARPTEYRTRKCFNQYACYDIHQIDCPDCGETVVETEEIKDE